MNADMKWLDNPEVFKVNQLESHSDHCYYLDYSDMKKEKNPLVSIIVPVYNVEKYVEQCILSLLNQTYRNIEIIAVNDGSKDESPQKILDLAKKDKRIKLLNQENKGVSATRNNGLNSANGDFIIFVDADVSEEIFLAKYKLGKNLKGVADFLKKPSQMYDLICKTNNPQLDIIFTGVLDDGVISEDEESMMKQFIDMYSDKYDRIVLSSDVDGRIAKYCDGTVIMYEESEFGELSAENYVDELENNKCNVLGVVING